MCGPGLGLKGYFGILSLMSCPGGEHASGNCFEGQMSSLLRFLFPFLACSTAKLRLKIRPVALEFVSRRCKRSKASVCLSYLVKTEKLGSLKGI